MDAPHDRSPIRVLLADGDRALANVVYLVLLAEGWVVDVAHTAADALDRYAESVPDVVLLDGTMPDAHALTDRVVVPVLFLDPTGQPDGHHLPKPFTLEDVVARVRTLVRRDADTDASPNLVSNESELLRILTRHSRTALSKDQILLIVEQYVSRLRGRRRRRGPDPLPDSPGAEPVDA